MICNYWIYCRCYLEPYLLLTYACCEAHQQKQRLSNSIYSSYSWSVFNGGTWQFGLAVALLNYLVKSTTNLALIERHFCNKQKNTSSRIKVANSISNYYQFLNFYQAKAIDRRLEPFLRNSSNWRSWWRIWRWRTQPPVS